MRKYLLLLHVLILSFVFFLKPTIQSASGCFYDFDSLYKLQKEAFKQAIRINPDDADAHFELGIAHGEFGMYKEAVESLKQVLRIKPDSVAAHYYLGLAYAILNDRGSALEQYKILKILDSERANELNELFNKIYE